jgi:hypothetical protein
VSIYGGGGGKRRDRNEPEVIQAFRIAGCSVWQLSGRDIPDLLVGLQGHAYPVEVKDRLGKVTPGQLKAFRLWRGSPVEVVRSAAEAHSLAEAWRGTQEPGRREPFTQVDPPKKTRQRGRTGLYGAELDEIAEEVTKSLQRAPRCRQAQT